MPATSKRINWQAPMLRVLGAVAPVAAAGICLFGWRVAVMLLLANAAAFAAEWAFTHRAREPVSSAVFVTATLYVLSLPPALPLPMTLLGIVFAIVFGKMVFGGFGRNVFNPALTGRAFIYVCFGNYMTAMWTEPFGSGFGGLAAYARGADAMTTATPGMLLKQGASFDLWRELIGNTSGVIGGTTAALALLGGLYLLWTRTASYRIVIPGLLGYLGTQGLLWHLGAKGAAEPLHGLLSSSFMIGVFFYATDPVSAAQTNPGRWIYGAFIGSMSSVISVYSAWPAGTMFAILLGNAFAPIVDYTVRELQPKPAPARAAAAKPAAAPQPK